MIKNFRLLGFLAVAALILTASTTMGKEVALDMDVVKAEIQAMEDAYAAGEKAKDADAIADYYGENAISYGQNNQPIKGKKAIRANMADRLAKDTTGTYNLYKVVDIFAAGDGVIEIGSWTELDAAGSEVDNGNYMSYFEKQNGQYKCVRDMSTAATLLKSAMRVAPVVDESEM
jgi:ketosteroid isomerase-like protein